MSDRPTIRAMDTAELDLVLDWAAEEGWNPGVGDASPFQAADPEGFLLASVGGEPVAAISVANHSDRFAFLGLYLCRPAWRGRGIGWALWTAGLLHAGDRTIGLDGVAAQEGNYARSGFVRVGATIRLEGWLDAPTGSGVRASRTDDLPAILALDRAATGTDRRRFLSAWVAECPDRRTHVYEEGGQVVGFATARACRAGSKVGPIVAPDAATALRLAGANPFDGPTAIDVPEANHDLIAALTARGFAESFRTARMYRGTPPSGDHSHQAIGSMELG